MNNGVAPAVSITHQHIVAIINTLLGTSPSKNTIRILDLGCGNGKLIGYMLSALTTLRPGLQIQTFGLDVSDASQHDAGYFDQTKRDLARQHPAVDWNERLSLITARDEWPYPDQSFDFITSNQVMEHVADHAFVFSPAQSMSPGPRREREPVSRAGNLVGGARKHAARSPSEKR